MKLLFVNLIFNGSMFSLINTIKNKNIRMYQPFPTQILIISICSYCDLQIVLYCIVFYNNAFRFMSAAVVAAAAATATTTSGSFHVVKSPMVPHAPSQMFLKKITKNTSMSSNDTSFFLDADLY